MYIPPPTIFPFLSFSFFLSILSNHMGPCEFSLIRAQRTTPTHIGERERRPRGFSASLCRVTSATLPTPASTRGLALPPHASFCLPHRVASNAPHALTIYGRNGGIVANSGGTGGGASFPHHCNIAYKDGHNKRAFQYTGPDSSNNAALAMQIVTNMSQR